MSEPTREWLEEQRQTAQAVVAYLRKHSPHSEAVAVITEREAAAFALALEALDRRAQTCETCRWQTIGISQRAMCRKTAQADGVHAVTCMVPCDWLGNGCSAHERKEDDK